MKQKLLRSRIGAAFGGNQQQIDPANLPEEEKARLLLGSKLMVSLCQFKVHWVSFSMDYVLGHAGQVKEELYEREQKLIIHF